MVSYDILKINLVSESSTNGIVTELSSSLDSVYVILEPEHRVLIYASKFTVYWAGNPFSSLWPWKLIFGSKSIVSESPNIWVLFLV